MTMRQKPSLLSPGGRHDVLAVHRMPGSPGRLCPRVHAGPEAADAARRPQGRGMQPHLQGSRRFGREGREAGPRSDAQRSEAGRYRRGLQARSSRPIGPAPLGPAGPVRSGGHPLLLIERGDQHHHAGRQARLPRLRRRRRIPARNHRREHARRTGGRTPPRHPPRTPPRPGAG